MKKRYYAAYGSNLNVRQMYMRCPSARIVGTSFIDGYELLFKGSLTGAYLTIEKKPGSKAPVALWEVSAEDELSLDRYEGYPRFYYKAEMKLPIKGIRTGRIRNRSCFVYIMHEDREFGIPASSYVTAVLEGYNAFHFDERYLFQAVKRTEEAVKHERSYHYNQA